MTDKRTNESRCLLAHSCKLAAAPQCNDLCEPYIAVHGYNGKGGRVGATGLPTDYRLVTLTNSPAREGQAKVYGMLERYSATFERQFDENADRIKSLYLWSESPGTGKTTSAAAVMNEWIRANYLGAVKRGLQPEQQPAYFLDVNEFQTEYNLAAMTDDDEGMARIKTKIKLCQSVPFLVCDDIGVRGASDAFRSYIHAIINYRATNGIPTVYTSNFALPEMARIFDDRLYDRIRDQCAEIHFGGTSKRGRR